MLEYYLSKIVKKAHMRAIRNSEIDKTAGVCAGTQIIDSSVGRYTDIGYDCVIVNTIMDNYCSLGADIRIGGAAHPVHHVSTSTVFLKEKDHIKKKFAMHSFEQFERTIIGHDVWIGDGAFIKSGVKIGTGAVVGMGAVVTKDIAPYEIWAGNPAHKIKDRFDTLIKQKLLDTEWWNYTDEKLQEVAESFDDVEAFLRMCEREK